MMNSSLSSSLSSSLTEKLDTEEEEDTEVTTTNSRRTTMTTVNHLGNDDDDEAYQHKPRLESTQQLPPAPPLAPPLTTPPQPPTVFVDIKNLKPTLDEKRAIIKTRLEIRFPLVITSIFAILLILIGLAAIALELVLIHFRAVNYKFANGIWGGYFCIVNGFLKIILGGTRSYTAYLVAELITVPLAVAASIGISILSGNNIHLYFRCHTSSCSAVNLAITIAMLVLGVFALVLNIVFILVFNLRLFGRLKRVRAQRLTWLQLVRELYAQLGSRRRRRRQGVSTATINASKN